MSSILTLTMNPAVDHHALVDIVADEKKLKCTSSHYEPGGGGINVSRALKILGGSSTALYPSGGLTGKLLEESLTKGDIQQKPISISQNTRINFSVIEKTTRRQYRFNMPGASLTDDEWKSCLQVLREFQPVPHYLVASGSLPPGVPDDFFARVAQIAREQGSRFILDTSSRGLRPALDEGVFLVKPNLREFSQILGQDFIDEQHIIEQGKQLIDQGKTEVLVISLGRSGAFFMDKQAIIHHTTPIVPIKSAVGAGDSMLAGITYKLSQGDSLQDAVQYGIAAGAAAVMTEGSELCTKEDTERLYQNMKHNLCTKQEF